MGKLFMLAILLLFSVEDIRFKSISEKWFWGLAVFVFLMLFIPPLWTIPGHHSLLSPNLIHFFLVNTGAYFFGDFAKSLSNSLFSSFPFIYFSDLSWFTYLSNLLGRALLGFLLLYLPYFLTRKKGIGEGDILYFTLVSFLFPVSTIWFSYFLAFFFGCFWVIFLFLFGRKKNQTDLCQWKIPFLPFLSIGFAIGLFF
jgi:Flp pilus assembly protein protease CpaA